MSIRTRLMWLVIVATLAPALLVGVRFANERARQVDDARAEIRAVAGAVNQELSETIQSTAQLLYGLARARDLDTRDRAACSAFLAAVRNQYPQYTGILTIDPYGKLFCDSLDTNRNLDLSDRGYFRRAKGLRDTVATEATFGRLTGVSVMQVAYPAATGADLKFVLLASIDLGKLTGKLSDGRLKDMSLMLVDETGTVLVAAPGVERARLAGTTIAGSSLHDYALTGASTTVREIADAAGSTMVWSLSASPDVRQSGLRILVGRSKADLVAEANRRLREDITVLAILFCLLFAGVWLLAELGVRRQISRIAVMAGRLAQGDLAARITGRRPRGELGGLMNVLNETAESLEKQRHDIEDLNRKLAQAQKMEAVGQLTGGMAHDFNNLLTVILGNGEFLAERLAHDPDLRRMAEATIKAAERGAELTGSLLAFARRQPLAPRDVDVAATVRGLEVILRRTLGENIECRFAFADDVRPALVDPAQLESALLNLVLNARDAMRGGGRLTVETAMARLDESPAEGNEDVAPGNYVMLAVTDTGTGMTPDILAQVFEPFFTTKEFGQGSGLGLSMVYGFVKQSGGHVKIYSEPGHGTTVRLYLPEAPGAAATTGDRSGSAARGGAETILVVEDDEMVRNHVTGLVSLLGYRVLAAADGAAALAVLRRPEAVDLLFTDVIMPGGMSGPQLAAAAVQLRPGIKVLYTSGYTENAVLHGGRLDPGVTLLSKPYRRHELAEKLRAALGR